MKSEPHDTQLRTTTQSADRSLSNLNEGFSSKRVQFVVGIESEGNTRVGWKVCRPQSSLSESDRRPIHEFSTGKHICFHHDKSKPGVACSLVSLRANNTRLQLSASLRVPIDTIRPTTPLFQLPHLIPDRPKLLLRFSLSRLATKPTSSSQSLQSPRQSSLPLQFVMCGNCPTGPSAPQSVRTLWRSSA